MTASPPTFNTGMTFANEERDAADERRRTVLRQLDTTPRTVKTIMARTLLGESATRRHLHALERLGWATRTDVDGIEHWTATP